MLVEVWIYQDDTAIEWQEEKIIFGIIITKTKSNRIQSSFCFQSVLRMTYLHATKVPVHKTLVSFHGELGAHHETGGEKHVTAEFEKRGPFNQRHLFVIRRQFLHRLVSVVEVESDSCHKTKVSVFSI